MSISISYGRILSSSLNEYYNKRLLDYKPLRPLGSLCKAAKGVQVKALDEAVRVSLAVVGDTLNECVRGGRRGELHRVSRMLGQKLEAVADA